MVRSGEFPFFSILNFHPLLYRPFFLVTMKADLFKGHSLFLMCIA